MTTVQQLLQNKGYEVWTIGPDASVYEALQTMADKNIGALIVVEGEDLVGIMSERDYARKVALVGKTAQDTKVKEIMTDQVYYVRPEQTIEECMSLMTDKRIRHLPVLDYNKLSGVISIGDVVKAVISKQEFLIEQLENYIVGGGG
jgi:CBS domain-containing protein